MTTKEKGPEVATNNSGALKGITTMTTNTTDLDLNTPEIQKEISQYTEEEIRNPYAPKFKELVEDYGSTCKEAMDYTESRGVPWEYAVQHGARFVVGTHGKMRGKLYHEKHGVPNRPLPLEVMSHKEFYEAAGLIVPVDTVGFLYALPGGRKYPRARFLEKGYDRSTSEHRSMSDWVDLSQTRYMTPKLKDGECVPPFFNCLSGAKVFTDTSIDLYIVEGIMKAMCVAYNLGVECIALGGVNAGALDAGARRTLGRQILNQYFQMVKWKGRTVYIVFDAGRAYNPSVALAMVVLADVLREKGAIVKYVEIPLTEEDKDQGPDDYFVSPKGCNKDPEVFRDLISKAIPSGVDLAGRSFECREKDLCFKAEIYHAQPSAIERLYVKHKKEIGAKGILTSLGDDFQMLLRDRVKREKQEEDPRPRIKWAPTELHTMVKDTIKALATHPDVYVKSKVLVQHYPDVDAKNSGADAVMVPFTADTLATELTKVAIYTTETKEDGEVGMVPPSLICNSTMNQGSFPGVKTINSIVRHPIFLPSGKIHWNGYNEETGYLVISDLPAFDLSNVTKEDARAALDVLIDLYHEFPYENKTHRSAALALALTLPARPAIKGPTPMFLWDGSDIGSGKSYQTDIPAMLWQGRRTAEGTNYVKNAEEARKGITSTLMGSPEMVTFVNVFGPFGNDVIDNLITKQEYRDRILGITKLVVLENIQSVLCVDGTQLSLKNTDSSRRVLFCRLIARPNQMEYKFKKNLDEYVPKHRHELMRAGLTVLAGYFQARDANGGVFPHPEMKTWNQFGKFSELIRGCLMWLGEPDPHGNYAEMRESADLKNNKAVDIIQALIQALRREPKCQASSQELSDWASAVRKPNQTLSIDAHKEVLTTALESFLGVPKGKPMSKDEIAFKLRGYKDTWREGWAIVQEGTGRPRPWTLKYKDGRLLNQISKSELEAILNGEGTDQTTYPEEESYDEDDRNVKAINDAMLGV